MHASVLVGTVLLYVCSARGDIAFVSVGDVLQLFGLHLVNKVRSGVQACTGACTCATFEMPQIQEAGTSSVIRDEPTC